MVCFELWAHAGLAISSAAPIERGPADWPTVRRVVGRGLVGSMRPSTAGRDDAATADSADQTALGAGVPAGQAARLALACCLGAGLGTLVDSAVVNYTVPYLGSQLSSPTDAVQWFLSAYSLTFGLGLVPAGRLGDTHGRKRLFVLGLIVFSTGAVASSLAPGVWFAVAGRLIQGFGAGLISAQVLGIIQDEFAGTARVRALASYSMVGATAVIVGPLLSGVLLVTLPATIGWRMVLLISVPIVLTTALVATRLPATAPPRAERPDLDLPGIAALGAIVVLVTLPVIDPGMPSGAVCALVSAVGVLAVVLAGWERHYAGRGRIPLFVPILMRSTGFVLGNVVALLWFGSVVALGAVITLFLLQSQGLTALAVASVLVPSALARIGSSWWSSRIYRRFGPRTVGIGLAGQALTTGGVLATTLIRDSGDFVVAIVLLEVCAGAASGLVEPPLRAVTLEFAPDAYRGVAASFLQLSQRLSATFCVALVTGLLLGSSVATGTSLGGFRSAVAVCALMTAVAAMVAWHPVLRNPLDTRRPTQSP